MLMFGVPFSSMYAELFIVGGVFLIDFRVLCPFSTGRFIRPYFMWRYLLQTFMQYFLAVRLVALFKPSVLCGAASLIRAALSNFTLISPVSALVHLQGSASYYSLFFLTGRGRLVFIPHFDVMAIIARLFMSLRCGFVCNIHLWWVVGYFISLRVFCYAWGVIYGRDQWFPLEKINIATKLIYFPRMGSRTEYVVNVRR